jgi:hypothetical protein
MGPDVEVSQPPPAAARRARLAPLSAGNDGRTERLKLLPGRKNASLMQDVAVEGMTISGSRFYSHESSA